MRFLESISDAVLGRSPEELIGALLIAAGVAVVVACMYVLGRRKASPSPTYVGGLGFAAGFSCMVLAAGYVQYIETAWKTGSATSRPAPAGWQPEGPGRGTLPPPWSLPGANWSSGFHIVVAADENRDGRLTAEEVARLVRDADSDGDGSVNFRDIDRLLASRLRPPFRPSVRPATGTGDRSGGEVGQPVNGRDTESSRDEQPSVHATSDERPDRDVPEEQRPDNRGDGRPRRTLPLPESLNHPRSTERGAL